MDECATYSDNFHNNATCNNTIGSFNCSCNVGFARNGTYCNGIIINYACICMAIFEIRIFNRMGTSEMKD